MPIRSISWQRGAVPDKVGEQTSVARRHRPQFVGTGRREKRRERKEKRGEKKKRGKKRKKRKKKKKGRKKKKKEKRRKKKGEKGKKKRREVRFYTS